MMFQAILSLSNHKGNLPKTKELFVPFHFRYLTIYENGNFFLKTNCNAQVEHFFLFFIFSPFFFVPILVLLMYLLKEGSCLCRLGI